MKSTFRHVRLSESKLFSNKEKTTVIICSLKCLQSRADPRSPLLRAIWVKSIGKTVVKREKRVGTNRERHISEDQTGNPESTSNSGPLHGKSHQKEVRPRRANDRGF